MADADDVEAGGGGPACAGQQSAVDEADVAPLLKSTNSSSHPAKADRTSKENSILLSLLKSTKALLGAIWDSGALCVTVAAIVFAFSALFVKMIHGRVPVFEIVSFRSSTSFLVCALVAHLNKPPMKPFFGHRENIHLLISRGLFGAIAMSTYYFSLQALPLADAVTLFFFNPCITALAAALFLREPLGIKGSVGVAVSIAGLIVLAHPPFLFGGHEGWDRKRILGTMFGVISAMFAAGAFISIRLIGKREPALIMSVYFHMSAFITTSIPLACSWPVPPVWPGALDMLLLLLGIAFTSFFGQVLIGRGFQLLHAAKASAINFTQVIYSYLMGAAFLHERLSPAGAVGSLLIAAGVITVNMREKAKPKDPDLDQAQHASPPADAAASSEAACTAKGGDQRSDGADCSLGEANGREYEDHGIAAPRSYGGVDPPARRGASLEMQRLLADEHSDMPPGTAAVAAPPADVLQGCTSGADTRNKPDAAAAMGKAACWPHPLPLPTCS